jgi:ribose 5-phosphate isomerase RpiB
MGRPTIVLTACHREVYRFWIGEKLAECMVAEYLSCTYDPNSRSKDKVQRIVDFENE